MLLNNNQDEQNKKDVESVVKILEEKNEKEKIITLPSNTKGKIIANNQAKIIAKIKTLIGSQNLKDLKIEVSMQNDTNISTTSQKIIIKLTKNEFSKEIKDFSVKKKNVIDEKIESIKKILDAKSNNELIITLSNNSTGKIIGKVANKNAIIKKLRTLIDSSNSNGEANHASLKGTTIEVSMNPDAPISTTAQNIIVSISKSGGKTLKTTSIFQVKRAFTTSELANKDIVSIKKVLDSKSGNHLIINLPSNSVGNIIGNNANKDAIIKKLRTLIDSSNTNGIANHPSLKGTTIEVSMNLDAPISTTPQNIIIAISKTNGKTLRTRKTFRVKRELTIEEINEDIKAIKKVLESLNVNDRLIVLPSTSGGSIINNLDNKNAIERKVRKLIDPLNIDGNPKHPSLKGTTITLTKVNLAASVVKSDSISIHTRLIIITISKTGGTSLEFNGFGVRKSLNN